MFAALNILICLVLPGSLALIASAISLSALRRHVTVRQALFTGFVVVASVSAVSSLCETVFTGTSGMLLPVALIGFTLMFAMAQFLTAMVLGGLGRLKQKMS